MIVFSCAMAKVAHADAVAGRSFKLTYIFVFIGFIAETRMIHERNTLVSIGEEGAGLGLTAADFFGTIYCS